MGKRSEGVGRVVIGGGIIAAILLLISKGPGPGLGLSGGKKGSPAKGWPPPKPVSISVTSEGIFLDGKQVLAAEAVEAAQKPGLAEVRVTGDATFGVYEELLEKLRQAKVAVKTF